MEINYEKENMQALPTDPVPGINVVKELTLTNNVKCEEDPLGDDDATPERQKTYTTEYLTTPVHSPKANDVLYENGEVIVDVDDDISTPARQQQSPLEGETKREPKTNYSSDEELPNDFFDELLHPEKREPNLEEPEFYDIESSTEKNANSDNGEITVKTEVSDYLERKRFKIEHELQMLEGNTLTQKDNKRKKKKRRKRSDSGDDDLIYKTHLDRHKYSRISEKRKSIPNNNQKYCDINKVSNSDDDELLFKRRRVQRNHSKNSNWGLERDRKRSRSSSHSPGPSYRDRQRRCSTSSDNSNRLQGFDQPSSESQFRAIKLEKLLAPPIPLALTPAEKIRAAVSKAENLLKKFEEKSKGFIKEFIFTPTICPAINTGSLISISTNTNRSPLSSNNVIFQLTSTGPCIDTALYGLQQPPPSTVEVMRLMQFDINSLEEKRKSVRMPPKVLKRINEAKTRDKSDNVGVAQSVLYKDAKTQTDDTYFEKLTHNVGTQCRDENFIDTSLMNERQKYAIHLCQKLLLTLPNNATDEMQQNTNLLNAIKVARGSLRRMY